VNYFSYEDRLRQLAQEANAYADSLGLPLGGHNDERDAFRHAYSSAVLDHEFGKAVAKFAGDANEFLHPGPSEEYNMDQWNNEVGRELGEGITSPFYKDEIAQRVYNALQNGELITDPGTDPRVWNGSDYFQPGTWPDPSNVPFPIDPNSFQDSIINTLKDLFGTAEITRSPIILDLNGDGVKTISLSAGTHFDLDGNHFAEQTGWASKDDGLLIWDRNGNAQIDDGSELFGNYSRLGSGDQAANGFAALGDLDGNHDGKVDANDAAFADLRVWKDSNSDGVVGDGELLSLTDAGVQSLGVSYTQQTATDAEGNQHLQIGQYVGTDGVAHAMDDVWFAVDTARTLDLKRVEVSAAIAALPDVAGFGNVYSLHQAMAQDATGRLQTLVQNFVSATDPATRVATLTELIYVWAGVDGVDPNSRAASMIYGNAIGDARKLATLEAFLGEGYFGTWCWGERDPNPHGPASRILLQAFDKLTDYVSSQLLAQTDFKGLYDSINIVFNTQTSSFDLDVTAVVSTLQGVRG